MWTVLHNFMWYIVHLLTHKTDKSSLHRMSENKKLFSIFPSCNSFTTVCSRKRKILKHLKHTKKRNTHTVTVWSWVEIETKCILTPRFYSMTRSYYRQHKVEKRKAVEEKRRKRNTKYHRVCITWYLFHSHSQHFNEFYAAHLCTRWTFQFSTFCMNMEWVREILAWKNIIILILRIFTRVARAGEQRRTQNL